MAKSKYELEILGDNSKFNRTVSQSMERLDELSAHTGGFFNGIAGGAQRATGALNALTSMSPAMAALGVAGAGAALAIKTFLDTAEYVGGLNDLAKTSGMNVELLQQLQKEFRSTGLEIQQFGDLNRDTLDHLGDSIRAGKGGVADDLKEWGISLKEFTGYVGQADGGIKALIQTYYKLKEAGASQAEVVNGMETMASNGSLLITQLEHYNSAQEAYVGITQRSVTVTEENARKYAEFGRKTEDLKQKINEVKVGAMEPLLDSIIEVWDWFDKDWSNTGFFKGLKKASESGAMSPSGMNSGQLQNIGKSTKDLEAEKQAAFEKDLDRAKKKAEENYLINQKAILAQKRANEQIAKVEQEEAEKAAAKAKADADKRAREAAAANAKMLTERAQAVQQLEALNTKLYSGTGATIATQIQQLTASVKTLDDLYAKGYVTQEQYTEKRKALINRSSNDMSLLLLGAGPQQLSQILGQIKTIYDNQENDLKIRRDKGLIDAKTYQTQLETLEMDHAARMSQIKGINVDQVNSQMATDMGGDTVEDRMALAQAQLDQQAMQWAEAQKSMYDGGLIDYETFLQNKNRLDEMYSSKSRQISMMEAKERLQTYTNMADGIGAVASLMGGEQSKAAKAAFAVSKGLSVAQGLINANEAATKAMAMYPGPIGIAMAATSYASAIGQVMQMKSVQGQFHDGIDDVPNTGTYLLEGGERVVDKRLNQDLKDFLGDANSGSNQPAQNIDASISNIRTTLDERQLMNVLKKQQQTITSIVNDGNRRKM